MPQGPSAGGGSPACSRDPLESPVEPLEEGGREEVSVTIQTSPAGTSLMSSLPLMAASGARVGWGQELPERAGPSSLVETGRGVVGTEGPGSGLNSASPGCPSQDTPPLGLTLLMGQAELAVVFRTLHMTRPHLWLPALPTLRRSVGFIPMPPSHLFLPKA